MDHFTPFACPRIIRLDPPRAAIPPLFGRSAWTVAYAVAILSIVLASAIAGHQLVQLDRIYAAEDRT